jgi:hypothetical protein
MNNLLFFVSFLMIFLTFFERRVEASLIQDRNNQVSTMMIFQQPILPGIADNFQVPISEGHKYPNGASFYLILWQPDPYTPNGSLVPTNWSAGDRTGFYPNNPLADQAGFQNVAGSSTAQIEGGIIGAYLNSNDVRPDAHGQSKMMITPVWKPAMTRLVYPFATPGNVVISSLDLQVPVARDQNRPGNYTYVTDDLLFEDFKSHTRISYGVVLFHHTPTPRPPPAEDLLRKTEIGGFDVESRAFQFGNPLEPDSRVTTILPGSETFQNQPWTGWRSFGFALTQNNFAIGLQGLLKRYPSFDGSTSPSDYALVQWHLNAELQFATGPAELGWSMRDAIVEIGKNP